MQASNPSLSESNNPQPSSDRLAQQLRFIVEIDRLKTILRQTPLADGSRRENSAEHSWHLALMAMLLAEHSGTPDLDLFRVVKLVLVHDIIEIDAGDTFFYDEQANLDKHERETLAAARLFALLPPDQAVEMQALWEEFEHQQTPESRFANALDRLQPLLLNVQSGGGSWRDHSITHDRVLVRMRPIETASPSLWAAVEQMLEESIERGILAPAP
jgi:putative hydrolase of HD superfamily